MAVEEQYGVVELLVDLENLVSAGLLEEIRGPGEPARYVLSALGESLTGSSHMGEDLLGPASETAPVWPEPELLLETLASDRPPGGASSG